MVAENDPVGGEEPIIEGRHAYAGLNRVIHEKARLGIMMSLVPRRTGLTFGELKQLCRLTDGNLNRHLEVLSDAGLVSISKSFVGKRPQTRCQVTPTGRETFQLYLAELERVVRDAAEIPEAPPAAEPGMVPG